MIKILLAGALCTVAFGQTIVIPSFPTTTGGTTSGPLPTSPVTNVEIQEGHHGNFAGLPAGGVTITGFAYRAAPGTGALHLVVSGSVFLSTSSNFPDTFNGHTLFSTTFANNVGADVKQVLTFTNFHLDAPGCAVVGTNPCPFGTNISLTTPFFYDPANGSLLFDLKFTSFVSTGTGQFDNVTCPLFDCAEADVDGTLGSPTGSLHGGGNITQLTFTTAPLGTPIPPSILITMLGLTCVGFYAASRGRKLA